MMARTRKRAQTGHDDVLATMRAQRLRKAVLLAAVGVLMAVPPVFVNHPIGYLPILSYALLLAMCWVYLALIKHGFSVEHRFAESSCVRGGQVELPITLVNRSGLPILHARPLVHVKNPYGSVDSEVLAVAVVDAHGTDQINAHVQLGHIGTYTAGLQGVLLRDPMQFFSAFVRVSESAALMSTPREFVADAVELSDMAVHESSAPIRTVISDNVDYAGTRDYEYGDPMKSVHWKLSARMDSLQTRLFEASVNTKMCVIMDFHSPAYETEELMECADAIVEMALAVMRMAKRRNLEADLAYVDKRGAQIFAKTPESDEMGAFVSGLPLPSPQVQASDALDIARHEVKRPDGSDTIVLCTSALGRELAAQATSMRAAHLSVSVIVAVPRARLRAFRKEAAGILGELSTAGVSCVVLSDTVDFQKGAQRD